MAYAIDELVRRGAPKPTADTKSWLESLSSVGFFTRRKHSGNHIYVFPLTKAAKLAGRMLPQIAYPVLDRNPIGSDVTALPLLKSARFILNNPRVRLTANSKDVTMTPTFEGNCHGNYSRDQYHCGCRRSRGRWNPHSRRRCAQQAVTKNPSRSGPSRNYFSEIGRAHV